MGTKKFASRIVVEVTLVNESLAATVSATLGAAGNLDAAMDATDAAVVLEFVLRSVFAETLKVLLEAQKLSGLQIIIVVCACLNTIVTFFMHFHKARLCFDHFNQPMFC